MISARCSPFRLCGTAAGGALQLLQDACRVCRADTAVSQPSTMILLAHYADFGFMSSAKCAYQQGIAVDWQGTCCGVVPTGGNCNVLSLADKACVLGEAAFARQVSGGHSLVMQGLLPRHAAGSALSNLAAFGAVGIFAVGDSLVNWPFRSVCLVHHSRPFQATMCCASVFARVWQGAGECANPPASLLLGETARALAPEAACFYLGFATVRLAT